MKKFFEEPSIECLVLHTESITNDIIDGSVGTGEPGENWN